MFRLVLAGLFVILSACTLRAPDIRPEGSVPETRETISAILDSCSDVSLDTDLGVQFSVLLLPSAGQACVAKYESALAVQMLDEWVRRADGFALAADHIGIGLAIAGTAALLDDASTGVLETIGALAIALTGYRNYRDIASKRTVVRSASNNASCLHRVSVQSEYWLSRWEDLIFEGEQNPAARAVIRRETEMAIAALTQTGAAPVDVQATYNTGQSAYLKLPVTLRDGLRKLAHHVEDGFDTSRGSVADFTTKLRTITDEEREQKNQANRAQSAAPGLNIRRNKGPGVATDSSTLSFNTADLSSVSSELVKNLADAKACSVTL